MNSDKIQLEIFALSATPTAGGAYAIILKEVNGNRRLPIIIGAYEAQAIALELEGIKPPRPLTHDLTKSIIEHLGANLSEVVIDELRDNTFFAKMYFEMSSLNYEVDSRPSDAIAMSVRFRCPIYATAEVMNEASFVPSEEEEESFRESNESDTSKNLSIEDKIAKLQTSLREALEREEYERAAKLRDEIKKLSGEGN
ncbi:MAG: DUF151 domain-containing protein [Ignavibacteria bacterium]|nr:DUF151 domain-containing protein [Ignavibacteria bacterium]